MSIEWAAFLSFRTMNACATKVFYMQMQTNANANNNKKKLSTKITWKMCVSGGAISWAFRLLINDQYPQNVSAVWIMCAPLIVIFALYLQLHGSIVMPKNCLNFIDLNLIFHFERHFRLSPSHHNFHISNAWDNQWLGMIRINFQMNSKLKIQWHVFASKSQQLSSWWHFFFPLNKRTLAHAMWM